MIATFLFIVNYDLLIVWILIGSAVVSGLLCAIFYLLTKDKYIAKNIIDQKNATQDQYDARKIKTVTMVREFDGNESFQSLTKKTAEDLVHELLRKELIVFEIYRDGDSRPADSKNIIYIKLDVLTPHHGQQKA